MARDSAAHCEVEAWEAVRGAQADCMIFVVLLSSIRFIWEGGEIGSYRGLGQARFKACLITCQHRTTGFYTYTAISFTYALP